MKRLFALILAFIACAATAGPLEPNQLRDTQNNANDPSNGTITRYTAVPANGASCIRYFNGVTILPDCMLIGSGLALVNGSLTSTAPAQQPADWAALSGPTSIINKPTFATVAFTGQAVDVAGLATVAKTGSYADLTGTPTIPAAYTFNYGLPVVRTLALSTAYQASNPAKAAIVTVSPQCTASLTLTTGSTCTLQARIGTAGLTCSTGTVVATWVNGNTGNLTVGLNLAQTVGAPYGINLPIGASFILCPTAGTFTVTAAEQTAG